MKWVKRLKWLRVSKIVIPVALAVSLVFAGFTVYGNEAENFVINAGGESDVKLSLAYKADGSDATSRLVVPAGGSYKDATYIPNTSLLYEDGWKGNNLPDDIARQDGNNDGTHSVYDGSSISFYSFSFYLVNNSDRAVDVDMSMTIDEITPSDCDIDGAVRIMIIEGEPLLSDNSYIIYKKAETQETEDSLTSRIAQGNGEAYTNVVNFESDTQVFDRKGVSGYQNFASGASIRFTVVMWLEGWDMECTDDILGGRIKMHIDFEGE